MTIFADQQTIIFQWNLDSKYTTCVDGSYFVYLVHGLIVRSCTVLEFEGYMLVTFLCILQ